MARKQTPKPKRPRKPEVSATVEALGPPSALTCPDCGGALWEVQEGERYRCHVGHQFTVDELDTDQRDAVERALWTAVRALEEQADLRDRLARRAAAAGLELISDSYEKSARESVEQANTIREVLFSRAVPDTPSVPTTEVATTRTVRRRTR